MDGQYCNICSKTYTSYKSLWNHNKKYHNNNEPKINQNQPIHEPNINQNQPLDGYDKIFICKYCKKEYKFIQSRSRHELKCNNNENNILIKQNDLLKTELTNMNNTIENLKKQMIQLLNKKCKMHPKTFQKINNNLNNSTNINSNNTVNNIVNIVPLGLEDLDNILSTKEQINILNKHSQSLEYMIKYIHFNEKYPQFKNIMITNQQNNIAYRYDNIENKFIATDKNDLVDDLISCRTGDLEEFLDNNINQLENKTVTKIKEFINKITYDDKYDEFKKKQIKLLIYNNRDKITKEIYQDLEVII